MNHGMASWQELKIDYEINQISPNISTRLEDIERIPAGLGIKILTILIEWACQPQNTHPIEIARKKIKKIPSDWLIEHLPNVAKTAICLDDEWGVSWIVRATFRGNSKITRLGNCIGN